jgi:HEAT repeat protein
VAAALKLRALGKPASGATLALGELLWGEAADAVVVDQSVRTVVLAEVAAYALGGLGEAALPVLVLAQASDRIDAREAAGKVLKALWPDWARMDAAKQETPALLALLDGQSGEVRRAAARALGALGDARALEPLAALAVKATEPMEMRLSAVRALGRLADPDVAARVQPALKDESWVVRAAAAEVLGDLDPLPADMLLAPLSEPHATVRTAALAALRRAKGAKYAVSAAVLLKDPEPAVREAAVITLGELREPACLDPLLGALGDKSRAVREEAAYALGRLGDKKAVPALILLAQDEDPRLRDLAGRALGKLKDARAVDVLLLNLADEHKSVRETSADALRAITGQNLGADRARWEAWWKAQRK